MQKKDATTKPTSKNTTQQVMRRSVRQVRKTARRFGSLTLDTLKSLVGVGQRRVNRRSNRTISGRFVNDIITLAETTHIAGLHVDLSEILVEPRFLPAPEIMEPIAADDVRQEVFYVVPRMPDLPYLNAPYNLPSLRISELAVGHRKLAILGLAGSGRTTALMAIALWAVREIVFEEKDDVVKKRLEEEEAQLSEKERKELQRKREERLEQAREQIEANLRENEEKKKTRPVSAAEAFEDDTRDNLPPFEKLLPLYIHLSDLRVSTAQFGSSVDPAEPLVRALQRRVSTLTARTIPRLIYRRLEENRTLILIDGYDDLPAAEQKRARAWLRAFMNQYGDNFIIMTGPAIGYGKLVDLEMTPLFVKPWNQSEIEEYVDKWAAAWPTVMGTRRKPAPEVSRVQQKRVVADSYALNPAEITLKIWVTFKDEEAAQPYIDEWVQQFIQSQLPNNQDYTQALPLLQAAAAQQTDLGYFTRPGIEVLLKQSETSGTTTVTQQTLAQLDVDQDGVADDDTPREDSEEEEFEEEDDEAVARSRLLRSLLFTGLIIPFQGGRYRFRHEILAGYLASLNLTPLPEKDPQTLYRLAQNPAWKHALAFAAAHTDLSRVVEMRLAAHEDVLHSNLLDMALWLRYARDTLPWRDDLLARLGNAFVHQQQFTINRERITGVLVTSRDQQGALHIFGSSLKNADIDVRRLSCLGIGAVGQHGRRFTDGLIDLMFGDAEEDVQLAAIHALGAIGTETAKNAMSEILLTNLNPETERTRQAVAESFASMPKDGYPTLYDALSVDNNVVDNSMFVRRAAIFGLRRIETNWASELIRDHFLAESESYVRLLLEDVFRNTLDGPSGPPPPPTPLQINWIMEWAEEKGLPTQPNRIHATLAAALDDPALEHRAYGAVALGQFGVAQAIKPLYARLTDREPVVRDAAYRALVELQIRMGEPIPDPL